MKKLTLVALTSSLLISTSIQAKDKYFGIALEQANYTEPGISLSGNMLALKGGHFFNQNFAIEGKFGFGLSESSTKVDITQSGVRLNGEFSGKVNRYLSVLAVGLLPINDKFSGYGKIGFSNVNLTRSFTGTASKPGYITQNFNNLSLDDSGTSLSYAIGADFKINNDLSAQLEWASLYNRENITIDGIALGISKNF